MHRITQKDVRVVFARFAKACGRQVAGPDGGLGGKWSLDYAACYGGWQIVEYVPGGSAETHPLGDRRMSTAEIYHAMHFAIRAMEARS